jgi:hypothetical protein
MKMRRVVLESPFAGDRSSNIEYARRCIRDCLQRDESAIASHLLYTQEGILDDDVPAQRSLGIQAGLAWIEVADAMVVYIDRGISFGMRKAMEVAKSKNLRIEIRTIDRIAGGPDNAGVLGSGADGIAT